MAPPQQAPSFRRKVRSRAALAATIQQLHRRGKRVVFANGCFDILHVGHVTLLDHAKRLGDILVVAINSDRSVQGLKGPGRPVNREQDRAAVLGALASVDYVTVFDEPTPLELIRLLKPDVLVKGADWALKGIVGADLVKQHGGRVVRIRLVEGYSTTKLIRWMTRPVHHAASGP